MSLQKGSILYIYIYTKKRAICDGFSVSTALFFNHFLQCRFPSEGNCMQIGSIRFPLVGPDKLYFFLPIIRLLLLKNLKMLNVDINTATTDTRHLISQSYLADLKTDP